MKQLFIILLGAGMVAALASAQPRTATLDQMIAAGKSQRELAQYHFDTHDCRTCHNLSPREARLYQPGQGEGVGIRGVHFHAGGH